MKDNFKSSKLILKYSKIETGKQGLSKTIYYKILLEKGN